MPGQPKNRKDHILPQGYLDGFTNPDGILWVYHIAEMRWFPKRPQDVAWVRGFYDYSDGVIPDQSADEAFREHEGKYPEVRRALVASSFSGWRRHLPFLLEYFNHLRVRSVVWRQHVLDALDHQPPMVVDEVLETVPHPTNPEMVRQKVRVKPMPQTGAALKTALTNLTIAKCVPTCLLFRSFSMISIGAYGTQLILPGLSSQPTNRSGSKATSNQSNLLLDIFGPEFTFRSLGRPV
jgi:hypothetical protein